MDPKLTPVAAVAAGSQVPAATTRSQQRLPGHGIMSTAQEKGTRRRLNLMEHLLMLPVDSDLPLVLGLGFKLGLGSSMVMGARLPSCPTLDTSAWPGMGTVQPTST
jgi:hypothetical protein